MKLNPFLFARTQFVKNEANIFHSFLMSVVTRKHKRNESFLFFRRIAKRTNSQQRQQQCRQIRENPLKDRWCRHRRVPCRAPLEAFGVRLRARRPEQPGQPEPGRVRVGSRWGRSSSTSFR